MVDLKLMNDKLETKLRETIKKGEQVICNGTGNGYNLCDFTEIAQVDCKYFQESNQYCMMKRFEPRVEVTLHLYKSVLNQYVAETGFYIQNIDEL